MLQRSHLWRSPLLRVGLLYVRSTSPLSRVDDVGRCVYHQDQQRSGHFVSASSQAETPYLASVDHFCFDLRPAGIVHSGDRFVAGEIRGLLKEGRRLRLRARPRLPAIVIKPSGVPVREAARGGPRGDGHAGTVVRRCARRRTSPLISCCTSHIPESVGSSIRIHTTLPCGRRPDARFPAWARRTPGPLPWPGADYGDNGGGKIVTDASEYRSRHPAPPRRHRPHVDARGAGVWSRASAGKHDGRGRRDCCGPSKRSRGWPFHTAILNHDHLPISSVLHDKHFLRKHSAESVLRAEISAILLALLALASRADAQDSAIISRRWLQYIASKSGAFSQNAATPTHSGPPPSSGGRSMISPACISTMDRARRS